MTVDPVVYQPGELDEEEQNFKESFLERMLQRVKGDYEKAKLFRDEVNLDIVRYEYQYHNSQHLAELRSRKEFPVPIAQQLVDQLRATLKDKFAFAGRPCRVVGVEDSDKADAEAKQKMMDWQDYRDDVEEKIGQGILDAAIRGFACAQVDFRQSYRTELVLEEEEVEVPRQPVMGIDVQGIADRMGIPPRTEKRQRWVPQQVPDYLGAVVHLVDPHEVFFGPDKRTMGDPFPIMIRSMKSKEFFGTEDYFFNQDKLTDAPLKSGNRSQDGFKEQMTGDVAAAQVTQEGCEYIEWQGIVKADELARFEGKQPGLDPYVWAICGVVINQEAVVRLESQAHGLKRPNVVIGCMEMDGSIFRPVALMSKIYGICRGADQAAGQMIENIRSNIDRAWAIREDGLTNKSQVINDRAFILTCNRDPREVVMPLDQVPVWEPLAALIQQYYQMAKDATGLQAMTLGEGDPNAETLGESAMIEGPARLGVNAYLKTFENTFIRPLYEMRNQINAELIDLPFRFTILGEKAVDWVNIDPAQVRANVDFICEAASRETNRAVQTQQMLGFLKFAPQIQAMGFPVRADLIAKHIAEVGMTIPSETIESWLPMLTLEKEHGIDLGRLIAESALMAMGVKLAMTNQVGNAIAGGGAPNGAIDQGPMTEGAAQESANAQNQVDIGQPL